MTDVPHYEKLAAELNGLRARYKRLEEINEQLADTAAKEIAARDAKLEKLQRHVERLTEQLAGGYNAGSVEV